MSLEGGVVTRLGAVSGVTNLVGSRIYPLKLPQNPTLEAITYRVISDVPEHAMGSSPGPTTARVEVKSWGNDYDEAKDLAAQVHTALNRYRGTSDGTVFQDILTMDRGRDAYEDVPEENAVIQDFMVFYEE